MSEKLTVQQQNLVEDNLAFVTFLIKKYFKGYWDDNSNGTGRITRDDLFQEGVLGMTQAAVKWDPDKGTKFTTYSQHWIILRVKRYIDEALHPIHIPNKILDDRRAGHIDDDVFKDLNLPHVISDSTHSSGTTDQKLDLYELIDNGDLSIFDQAFNNPDEFDAELKDIFKDILSPVEYHIISQHYRFNDEYTPSVMTKHRWTSPLGVKLTNKGDIVRHPDTTITEHKNLIRDYKMAEMLHKVKHSKRFKEFIDGRI